MGLWWDVWSPLIEAAIYISSAIIGGYYIGLVGVLSGSLISLSIIHLIWKPMLLFHWGFKMNVIIYWLAYAKYTAMTLCASAAVYFLVNHQQTQILSVGGWWDWIIYAVKVCSTLIILESALFLIFSQGMRDFTARFIKMIHK